MPCYTPLKGYRCQETGSFTFRQHENGRENDSLTVPCGQCVGCRLERSRQWAVRSVHEASLYERNCFITLTYANEHLPPNNSLVYEDFQKFMKRFRKAHKGHRPMADGTRPIRFYMCGEYGENFGRPHYHACIFNFDFMDKKVWKKSPSGSLVYRSAQLEELWPFGFSSVGEVNFQSAAYVARYIMKKITGDRADSHYNTVDPVTGEVFERRPEFNKMSLKPGIGAGWLDKYASDVYPHDYVVINGKQAKPPRFYDKKYMQMLSDIGSLEWDEIEHARWEKSQQAADDNTPQRVDTKHLHAYHTLSKLKRKLT